MIKELWKTKKTQGFFCFALHSQKETKATNIQKPKKPWVFCFFSQFFNHHFIQKTKKTLSFFCFSKVKTKKKTKQNRGKPKKNKKTLGFFSFFKVKTKKKQKKLGKTKKKQTWASDQTFSEKFWFFVFLVFSRCFDFVNRAFPKSLQILFLVGFLKVFWFFGFSLWILSKIVVEKLFFVSNLFW